MTPELKPYPFCGSMDLRGPVARHTENAPGYFYTEWFIAHVGSTRQTCGAMVLAGNSAAAVEVWNRRV